MPRKRKERGRPARPLPPKIDATPEEIAQVFLRTTAPGPEIDETRVYCCADCGREVNYPETLYLDGRCAAHTTRPVIG
jgi:hypothetical protein